MIDDDDDDDCRVQWETEVLGENLAVPLCPLQIPHDWTRGRTQAVAVGRSQLHASATARFNFTFT
jgi:hypothetical protein